MNLSSLYQIFNPLKPLRGEDLEYLYVPRKTPIASNFSETIRMSGGDIKAVITGQPGSGKSTELSKVAQLLERDFFIVQLDAEARLDIFNVNHLEVLIGAVATMYKTAEDKSIHINQRPLGKITETLNRVTKKRGFSLGLEASKLLQMVGITFKFGLDWEKVQEISIEPEISDILSYIDESINEVKEATGYLPLWIIDGLDKIEFDMAKRIFAESQLLVYPNCPIIYSSPFALFHSPNFQRVRNYFSSTASYEIPNIALFERKTGKSIKRNYEFFYRIIDARLKKIGIKRKGFIENKALDLFIKSCGGVVREFIYLIQYAIQELKQRKENKIDVNIANSVIERVRKEKIRGLTKERLDILCQIYRERPSVLPSEIREGLHFELLQNLYILYYENKEPWYFIHPILESFIKTQCQG